MDSLLIDIADYVHHHDIDSPLAYDTARLCLMDSLGCGFLAMAYPECRKMLGPVAVSYTHLTLPTIYSV